MKNENDSIYCKKKMLLTFIILMIFGIIFGSYTIYIKIKNTSDKIRSVTIYDKINLENQIKNLNNQINEIENEQKNLNYEKNKLFNQQNNEYVLNGLSDKYYYFKAEIDSIIYNIEKKDSEKYNLVIEINNAKNKIDDISTILKKKDSKLTFFIDSAPGVIIMIITLCVCSIGIGYSFYYEENEFDGSNVQELKTIDEMNIDMNNLANEINIEDQIDIIKNGECKKKKSNVSKKKVKKNKE